MSNSNVIRFDSQGMVLMQDQGESVYAADPAGRIWMVYTSGATYKRSRLNSWHRVIRDPWPSLEALDVETIRSMLPSWQAFWKNVLDHIRNDSAQAAAARILQQWTSRFFEFHQADADRFRSVYGRIPILPPDAYQSLYIRLTEGCPWNRCTFCNFYEGQKFRVPTLEETRKHLAQVRDYWSDAVSSRTSVFLGDANALAMPSVVLRQRLDLVAEVFPESQFRRVHSFLDTFTGAHRRAADFKTLGRAGIERISIGVESGSRELMEAIGKPMEPANLEKLVDAIASAGIHINLIFIIGLGGAALKDEHFTASTRLIRRLNLQASDRIFLSPLAVYDAGVYQETARQRGWDFVQPAELRQELGTWRETIRAEKPNVQVSLYNIRQFDY